MAVIRVRYYFLILLLYWCLEDAWLLTMYLMYHDLTTHSYGWVYLLLER